MHEVAHKLRSVTVLGQDPGPKNWGLAVVRFDLDAEQRVVNIRPVVVRQMIRTPTGKGDTAEMLLAFSEEQRAIIHRFSPSSVVVERFLSRGAMGSHTAEQIGTGVGVIFEVCRIRRIRCRRIQAAQWKNELNRALAHLNTKHPRFMADHTPKPSIRKTKPFKNDIERQIYGHNPKAVHVIDALLIAIYDVDGFAFIGSRTGFARLVEVVRTLMIKTRTSNSDARQNKTR